MASDLVNATIKLDTVDLSPSYGAVLPLRDGRLMWVYGSGSADPVKPVRANFSEDGGATWSAPVHLKLTTGGPLPAIMETNIFRLKSGGIGLVMRAYAHTGAYEADYHAGLIFTSSKDEGATWSPPVRINPPGADAVCANESSIVLRDGRIVVPFYDMMGPMPTGDVRAIKRLGESFDGASRCALAYSSAYYSDDEGATWKRSNNEAFVVLDTGALGCYSMGEPAVVELVDGRVMMLGRTNLGRHFQCYSDDLGETWSMPEPTGLACYPSPATVTRIPRPHLPHLSPERDILSRGAGRRENGSDLADADLLVIWNQASQWETMNGLFRHRLTCAVSKDEGKTWQRHRNLESLDDVAYIEPGPVEADLIGKTAQPVDRKR